jgi:exoribonuclease-2
MAIMPKKSNFPESGSTDSLRASSIVMYENDNSALLACVQDFKKGKYIILNQKGRELELASNRLYSFHSLIPAEFSSKDSKAAYLEKLFNTAKESAPGISIEDLWSMINQENRGYSCFELAKNYLGDLTPEQHIAFRLALLSDKIFFKRKAEEFYPRPLETVEQMKAGEADRRKKQEAEQKAYSIFKNKINDPSIEIPSEIMPLIHSMEEVAAEAGNIDPNKVRDVRDFLHNFCEENGIQLSGANSERVYNFLRLINHFDNFTNLSLLRHRLQIEHSAEAIKEASEIEVKSVLEDAERLDLTALDCFTIDDNSTKDMDDAISLEYLGDGYRLGIHISDVASAIRPHSALDKASSYRLTSLYLPDRIINMLPEELSHNKISLLKDEIRPAVSFLMQVDRNYKILSCEVKLSRLKVKNRYNYDEVNFLLEKPEEHAFEVLHNITATHEMQRIEHGAIQLHKKEAYVIIKDKNNLELQEIDENSPSRRLISELMVISNSNLAAFAKANSIPFIYRTQERPDKDNRPTKSKSSESPSGDIASRMNLKKSLNTTVPKMHAGLGIDLYCQATSPIRRFLDSCNQRQIVSFLKTGEAFYSEKDLKTILFESDEDLQRYNVINRESKRFWILKYLEMHVFRKHDINGTVVRTDLRTPLVELEDVYIAVPVKLDGNISAGDKLKLKIAGINPAFDYLKLEQVK